MTAVESRISPLHWFVVSLFLIALAGASYAVYTFQEKKIERLQVEKQALQQQIASLQAANAELQRANSGLNTDNGTLRINLQVVCQQARSRLPALIEQKLDELLERDFVHQWQQICQSQSSIAPSP